MKQSDIGKIPEDWGTISFVKAISNVVDNRGKTAPTSKSGIALIATNCIKENALYPVKEKIRYVSKETYENWFRDHPKPDDIIIVNKGTPGLVCLVPNPVDFVIAQDMVAVRPDKSKIYGRFLFAFMRSKVFKHEVDSLNVGTTIPHLKKTYFPLLIVPLPSKYEQIVIGDFYYDLSKKIELNLKMNETLEAIGQAVFKRWFVDFEFPNGEGKPYKSSGGKMVYNSALDKEIPEGWKVKPIDEIADFLNGLALQKFPARDGEEYLPVIKIRELRQGITESSDKANFDLPKEYIVKNGDVLFSWSGSLEVVIWGFGKGALNQHLFKVTSSKYPKWFFYYWILQFLPEYRQIAAGKATTMGHIQRHHLTASKVTIPNDKTIERMNIVLAPILERIVHLKVETRTLVAIRDLLLPRLMSGKIRVTLPNEKQETN